MTSDPGPAATTIGSWINRLGPAGLLCTGCIFAVIAGLSQWAKQTPVSVVGAYFAVVGLVSIWLFYRICRMGVRFDDQGVTIRGVFHKERLSWVEVSHFTDGEAVVSDQGGSAHVWALEIVLRDGRSVTAPGTIRMPLTRKRGHPGLPKVLAKISQVAERYQIPAQLTGERSNRTPRDTRRPGH